MFSRKIFFVSFLICNFIYSNDFAKISGIITDESTPLESVNVFLENSSIGTTTNVKGEYILSIPSGNYILIVQAVGFKTVKKEISLIANENKIYNFCLVEDLLGLNQVVITATRKHLNKKISPVAVNVTDSKILEATQSINLSEGLNFQPGLRMETNCQNCGFPQVKINGLNGAYSQILINSRPVFSALNSVYGLDQIPTNIIERIEVVRGGGSALYGSNAIAGTINIITKDPTSNSFQIGTNLNILSDNSEDTSIILNGSIVSKDFDSGIVMSGMLRNRDAFDYNDDNYTEIPKMENKIFGFKTFYKHKEYNKITLEFNTIHEFRRGGNLLHLKPYESNITEQIKSDVITGGLNYEFSSKDLLHNVSFYGSTSYSKNSNFYGGRGEGDDIDGFSSSLEESLEGFGNSRDNTWVFGGQYSYDFEKFIGGSGTFTGGIEYKYNDLADNKPAIKALIKQTVKIYGLYAQQEWEINNRLKILGGLRADFHNLTDKNSVVVPRVNILYNITEDLQFRTSFAKGYRTPQIFSEDVHSSLASGLLTRILVAGETLKTETSNNYLVSLDWIYETIMGDISLSLEGFYTQLKDPFTLVDYEISSIDKGKYPKPNEGKTWVKENGDNANVKGLNFELKYAHGIQWVFKAGGTIQESKYENPQEWSNNVASLENADIFFKSPNFYGNFLMIYAPSKKFQNNISGVYTGSMFVTHIAGAPENPTNDVLEKTPDFFELNLKSSYTFSLDEHKHLKLQLSGGVQNIFDSYQQDFDTGPLRDANYIYGPTRPRTFFIGLKFGTDLN